MTELQDQLVQQAHPLTATQIAAVENHASRSEALLRQLGVVVIPDGFGDYEHNAALLVFDAQGRMVRVFDLAEQDLALNYARHLARQAQHPSAQGAV
jgi:cytochrome oxidase Cu insertion factor (SCO1/SenC/PrrC family)